LKVKLHICNSFVKPFHDALKLALVRLALKRLLEPAFADELFAQRDGTLQSTLQLAKDFTLCKSLFWEIRMGTVRGTQSAIDPPPRGMGRVGRVGSVGDCENGTGNLGKTRKRGAKKSISL
jgi:hypothetical protein